MALVRAFISGVRFNHEIDSDLTEATLTLNAAGPRYEAVSLTLPSSSMYAHEGGIGPLIVNSREEIERANIFILVVATELTTTVASEFRQAQSLGLPCKIFAKADMARSERLEEFLERRPAPIVEYRDRGELSEAVREFAFSFCEAETDREVVLEHTRWVYDFILRELARDPNRVFRLGHRKFEEFIAELIASHGYDVVLTQPTRDGGYDIFARARESLFPGKYLVEAKLWTPPKKVGVPVIRALYGVGMTEDCNGVMVVTPSSFTRDAIRFPKDRKAESFVRLVDGTELPRWYVDYIEWYRGTSRRPQ